MSDQGNPGAQHHGGNRRRFRNHLVNMDVRLRLVVDDAIFALVAALAAIGILYFLSNRQIGDSLYSAHLSIKETRELLNSGVKIAGLVTFVCVLAFGFWSVIDAHRIAGPMHRLRRLLTEIAEGDLTREIKFRKNDEFQDVANAADHVVDVYAARIAEVRAHAQSIASSLESDSISAGQLTELRATAKSLLDALGFFRIPDGDVPKIDDSPIVGKD